MKTSIKLLAIAAFVPLAAMAQSSLDEEVNAELDRMYQSQQPQAQRTTGPAVQVNVQAQPQVSASQSNNQGTTQSTGQYAGQTQSAVQAQKQPTTLVQATPLVESKADMIRKNRQDAELKTEETIVEKLEQSRLEDEKKRAEVLFGDKFNSLMNQNQQPPQQAPPAMTAPPAAAVPVVQQPATQTPVVVAPMTMPEQQVTAAPPVIIEKAEATEPEEKLDREAIRGEVSAALAEFKKEDEKPKSSSYFSVMAGSGDYPDAVNVKGQYALGVAYGKKFNDRMVAEGSFLYSNFQVEQPAQPGNGGYNYNYQTGGYDYYPRITEMNQYSTSGLVKYQLLGGVLRPEVGALMSYTYRTFSDKQFALTDATVSSQALDFGVMAGASVEMSDSFSLGLDFRRMWNLTNKVDGTTLQKSSIYQNRSNYTPIEEMSYYNLSVVGRATF